MISKICKQLDNERKIKLIESYKRRIVLSTTHKIYNQKTADDYKEFLLKIKGITDVEMHKDNKNDLVLNKFHHIFFDIDSTLTHKGIKILNSNVSDVFEDLIQARCRLYFCTGRTHSDVMQLMGDYDIKNNYSIAEGGGIIIDGRNYTKLGSKRNVMKFIHYMDKNKITYCEDQEQMNRITEFVILKKGISVRVLRRAIKESKIEVEYHASNNAYHISNKGINKGAGIRFLKKELDLTDRYNKIIGVGDSNLDVPMFDECDECYIVKGSALYNKMRKCHRLQKRVPYAINELRDRLLQLTNQRS